MEPIPAIDIITGKCVRLTKGDFKLKKVYSANPLRTAQLFQKAGLKRLHLIDLDGTKKGKIKNWKTIEKIAKGIRLLIEFGGGVREENDIKRLLKLGINRVIIGSTALREPQKFKNILKKFGGSKIIAAADVRRNKVCYRGWQREGEIDINSFLKKLTKLGIKTVLVTDIERDGTLNGPNFSLYKKLLKNFSGLEIIASGGIRNIQDLKRLSRIGVQGAIIGKAIYENKISLDDLKFFL